MSAKGALLGTMGRWKRKGKGDERKVSNTLYIHMTIA
jgi:hypothetical protein